MWHYALLGLQRPRRLGKRGEAGAEGEVGVGEAGGRRLEEQRAEGTPAA